ALAPPRASRGSGPPRSAPAHPEAASTAPGREPAASSRALLPDVIAVEEGIRPGARPGERVVLDHHRTVEHGLLLAVGLEALVRLGPDALAVVDLAEPLARAAARAVALVLRALRLGADVRDLGQRAVAAVETAEERHLGRLLGRMCGTTRDARPLLEPAVQRPPGRVERRLGGEDAVVHPAAHPAREADAQVGAPPPLRLEVGAVHGVGGEACVGVGLEEVDLAVDRVAQLRYERSPVVRRKAAGEVDDLAEGGGRRVAAEVDPAEAEAAGPREGLRRA